MNQIKVELQDTFGSDRAIAEAAWTSSTEFIIKQSKSTSDVYRIINMLADEKHSVPFESVIFRFWMRVPIAIDRQIMTHRIASHSGMSGRYRTMPSDYLSIPDDVKAFLDRNKDPYFEEQYNKYCTETNDFYKRTCAYYKTQKDAGIISNDEYKRIREFARGVLPQHNMTERVSIFNLRSWCNFYRLRHKSNAQKEIQIVADSMYQEILKKNPCPIALAALEKNNWVI